MAMTWADSIQELKEWNRRIDVFRPSVLPPTPGPRAPASEATLSRVEATLGLQLDAQHRSFLLHSDGWTGFAGGSISLASSAELLGSPLLDMGSRIVRLISGVAMGKYKRRRKNLLVIGASDCTLDVLCMPFADGKVLGPVVWFNNTEPEESSSFEMFFRTTISYMPSILENAQKRKPNGAAT